MYTVQRIEWHELFFRDCCQRYRNKTERKEEQREKKMYLCVYPIVGRIYHDLYLVYKCNRESEGVGKKETPQPPRQSILAPLPHSTVVCNRQNET